MVATLNSFSAAKKSVTPPFAPLPHVSIADTVATTTTTPSFTPAAPTTTPAPQRNFSAGNVYVEDLLGQQTASALVSKFPISFWQSHGSVKDEPSGVFTGQFNRDQSIVGAIWAQSTNSSAGNVTSAYSQIKLTIRGDPYWLGQTNLHRQINLMVGNISVSQNDLPDWVTGSQAIFVYFRYPYTTGDDFKPNLKSSTIFSGVYKVNKVTHFFSEGVFKQELDCQIDPLSDISLWGNPPNTSAAPASSGAASAPPTPTPVPLVTPSPTAFPPVKTPTSQNSSDPRTYNYIVPGL